MYVNEAYGNVVVFVTRECHCRLTWLLHAAIAVLYGVGVISHCCQPG